MSRRTLRRTLSTGPRRIVRRTLAKVALTCSVAVRVALRRTTSPKAVAVRPLRKGARGWATCLPLVIHRLKAMA